MTIAVIQMFEGATLDQYQQVLQRVQETLDQTPPTPAGSLAHWSALTDVGVRVDEVWESLDHFEQFSQQTLKNLLTEAGVKEPRVTTYTVHNFMITPTGAEMGQQQLTQQPETASS